MSVRPPNFDSVTAAIEGENIRKLWCACWEDLVRERSVAHIETIVGDELGNVHDIPGVVVNEPMVSITEARLIQGRRRKGMGILSADITPTVVTEVIEGLANARRKRVWPRVPPTPINAVSATQRLVINTSVKLLS